MTVEVKTKLTLDDNASSGLNGIREAFGELHEHAEKAQEGFSALRMVGAELFERVFEKGVETVKELGEGFVEAAEGGQQFQQRMAGMEAAVQGIDWNRAKKESTEFLEQTAEVAMHTREPIDDVREGFARLVEIQGATPEGIEKSKVQIEQMARVANVLGTNVETISSQFAFMEEGALKVKSQMFQLLQPTGIFEHQGMKATEYWQKLSNESRADLLAKGLNQLSSQMAQATPTFKDTITQLENVWTDAKERLGGPVIEALQPHLERLVKFVSGSTASLEEFGHELGDKVGEWVEDAAKEVKEGFDFIQEHEAEIGADIKEAWAFAKEVMDFIIQHKEVLALAAGAKMIAGSEGAKGAYNAVSGVVGGVYNAGSKGGAVFGAEALGGGVAGGAVALGAFTAAIGASVLALQQWDALMKETGGGKNEDQMNFEALKTSFQEQVAKPDMEQWNDAQLAQFDHMRDSFVKLAATLGEDTAAAGELADKAYETHRATSQMVRPLEGIADTFDQLAISSGQLDSGGAVEKITDTFQQASAAHNEAAMNYVANLLEGDKALQTAFLNSSGLTAEGFNELAAHISDSSNAFKEALMHIGDAGKGPKEIKHQTNFNGGQSFKINQDFRDQDPDRIAVLFRQDILKAAERRTQANTSTPFGT